MSLLSNNNLTHVSR